MMGLEWTEIFATALQLMLIGLALAIILHKNNGTVIILIASFSLVTASLYIINSAPDVAIAEVAIGSVIIPLIYVISISRQREFIVIDKAQDDFLRHDDFKTGLGYQFLKRFTDFYHLELNLSDDSPLCYIDDATDQVMCEETNVDLFITKDEKTGKYLFKGQASSLLMTKLETMAEPYDDIVVKTFADRDNHE
ncbi:MAG: Na(+)/H(+) antiporter subunit B [Bacillota bacterium]